LYEIFRGIIVESGTEVGELARGFYLYLTDEWVEFFWERDGGETAVN
jgi:hypothetical protein